jgi:hypothetical protein
MIASTQTRLHRAQLLEGWVERVDLHNRRLHVRTGSRDRIGTCVLIPDDCAILHAGNGLRLQSLLPCDAINIRYQEGANGARIARTIEVTAS